MIKLFNYFIDLIFPKQCIGCWLYWDYICLSCKNTIKKRNRVFIKWKKIKWIFALYHYKKNKVLDKYIHSIKYWQKYAKSGIFKKELISIINKYFHWKKIILIPIPLHWKRRLWRGFNQSQLLAQNLWIETHLLLKRIKNTPFQARQTLEQRKQNLKWAFKINEKININKETILILIDDVSTTWETVESAAKELKKYYKNEIFWLVLASDK